MERFQTLTFSLIKSAILGTDIGEQDKKDLTSENLIKIYQFSKFLDIAQIVGFALKRQGLLDGDIKKAFEKEIFISVMRVEKNDFTISEIRKILTDENIDFILLKGAVLRAYYPEKFFRTSADVDVFLKEDGFEEKVKLLTSKYNLKIEGRTPHDCTIISESGVHIELHFSIKEEIYIKNSNNLADKIWDYAVKEKDTSEYKLTNEYFAFYHLVHLSKHVQTGGCGIKPFIDNYFIEKLNINRELLNEMLKEAKLEKMYQASIDFTNYIFNDGEINERLALLMNFCLSGGVYGTIQNFVSVKQAKEGSRKGFIFSRIFMPYDLLKKQYPKLEKRKWLLPFYQILRWVKMIFSGRIKNTITEVKTNSKTTKENQEQITQMLKELELD